MKFTVYLVSIAFLFFSTGSVFADIIMLKDDSIVRGEVVKVADDTVQYKNQSEDTVKSIPKKNIKKVLFDNGSKIKFTDKTIDKNKKVEKFKRNYPVFGMTFGLLPTHANIVLGYSFRYIGLQVSGMYYGNLLYDKEIYGVQGNIIIKAFENRRFTHGISAVGGYYHYGLRDFYYVGAAYHFTAYGFFLEIGMAGLRELKTYSKGMDEMPLFQVGYVHRFKGI